MAEAELSTDTLSEADAINLLMGEAPAEAEQPAVETEDAPETEAPEAEAETEGDEQPEGDEPEAEEEAPAEPAAKIEAPKWWDAEAKAAFEDIPNTPKAREYALRVQQYVAEAEAKREAITQQAKAATKEATQQVETIKSALSKLEGAVPGEMEAFQRDYGKIDWAQMPQWAKENPAEAQEFFATYNARKAAVEHLISAKAEADKVVADSFAREQSARLREIAPDLAKNNDQLRALGDYAVTLGLAEALKQASADELVILNKARLWDEAQKKAAASAKTPKPQTTPAKTVKPVAAQVSGTHNQRQHADALKRLSANPKDEDAAIRAIMSLG